MNAQDRARALGQRWFDLRGVKIEAMRLDIHEHGHRATIANRIGGRNKRMTDSDDFIARLHAHREQRKVQRGRAIGHRTSVRRADSGCKFPLESRHLRPLRNPAAQNDASCCVRLLVAHHGFGYGYHASTMIVTSLV